MRSNTTKKETENLISVNRAASLLGRDRATLTRALQAVPPDGYARGHACWLMSTIRHALEHRTRREATKCRDKFSLGRNKALDGLRLAIERQVAAIAAAPSRPMKREMALALAPALQEYQVTYLDSGRSLGVADDDAICARSEMIFDEWMNEISEAAQWPRYGAGADFFIRMLEAMPGADDDEAA